MKKKEIGFFASVALIVLGFILRLNAQGMAWAGSTGFSGNRNDSNQYHMEVAYGQVALTLMSIGGLLLAITYVYWLFAPNSDERK